MTWCPAALSPATALQNNGMYIGVAFWPGGTVEDWGLVTDTETTTTTLDPCNKTNNYNSTGESSRSYLVRSRCHGRAVDTRPEVACPLAFEFCAPCPLLALLAMQPQNSS